MIFTKIIVHIKWAEGCYDSLLFPQNFLIKRSRLCSFLLVILQFEPFI